MSVHGSNQQSGETVEQCIMALYALAEHCDYGGMTDEMILKRPSRCWNSGQCTFGEIADGRYTHPQIREKGDTTERSSP